MSEPTPDTIAPDETPTATTTVVVKRTTGLTADELAGITEWADVAPFLAQFDSVASAVELGDGSDRVQKQLLVGKSFIILDVSFPMGEMGEYAMVRGITQNNTKFRFSDGSTGIYRQLSAWMARNNEQFRPIMVPNGLTASTYTVRDAEGNPVLDDKGNETKATTYYIDTTETTV